MCCPGVERRSERRSPLKLRAVCSPDTLRIRFLHMDVNSARCPRSERARFAKSKELPSFRESFLIVFPSCPGTLKSSFRDQPTKSSLNHTSATPCKPPDLLVKSGAPEFPPISLRRGVEWTSHHADFDRTLKLVKVNPGTYSTFPTHQLTSATSVHSYIVLRISKGSSLLHEALKPRRPTLHQPLTQPKTLSYRNSSPSKSNLYQPQK